MRVLIIGYGKMGRIHAKHLTELGVPWDYHDPHVPGGVGLERLSDGTHAIVATPIDTHYDVYRRLDGFPGRILIEKPVVTRAEHLHVLDDPRVFPGMCERFNPAVIALRRMVNPDDVVALEFCRTTRSRDVADAGIHDLDLFCHLCCLRSVPKFCWEGDSLIASAGQTVARFRWPVNEERRRTLVLTTLDSRIEVDLVGQTIDGRPCGRAPPVLAELAAFLKGETLDAAISHKMLADVRRAFEAVWESLNTREKCRILQFLIERVDYDGAAGTTAVEGCVHAPERVSFPVNNPRRAAESHPRPPPFGRGIRGRADCTRPRAG